jgi:hypothetical protein
LKITLQRMSGVDLSDVRVHARSPQPARLSAWAYACGKDIHLGPGQEKHLAHEAWHVVQQKQGRVRARRELGGMPANHDPALESEADRMARRAASPGTASTPVRDLTSRGQPATAGPPVVQPVLISVDAFKKATVAPTNRWDIGSVEKALAAYHEAKQDGKAAALQGVIAACNAYVALKQKKNQGASPRLPGVRALLAEAQQELASMSAPPGPAAMPDDEKTQQAPPHPMSPSAAAPSVEGDTGGAAEKPPDPMSPSAVAAKTMQPSASAAASGAGALEEVKRPMSRLALALRQRKEPGQSAPSVPSEPLHAALSLEPAQKDANDPGIVDKTTNAPPFTSDLPLFRPLHHINEFPKLGKAKPLDAEMQSFLTAWTRARYYHRTEKSALQGAIDSGGFSPEHAGTGITKGNTKLQQDAKNKVYMGWRPEVYRGETVVPMFMYANAALKPDYETMTGMASGYSHYVEGKNVPIAGDSRIPPGVTSLKPDDLKLPPGYAVVPNEPSAEDQNNPGGIRGEALDQVLHVLQSHYQRDEPTPSPQPSTFAPPTLPQMRALYQRALSEGLFGPPVLTQQHPSSGEAKDKKPLVVASQPLRAVAGFSAPMSGSAMASFAMAPEMPPVPSADTAASMPSALAATPMPGVPSAAAQTESALASHQDAAALAVREKDEHT